MLPYFASAELREFPLVLSSIGRWSGEEDQVIEAAARSGHEIKAVVLLNVSEADVENRFEVSKALMDRGAREDDKDIVVFRTRLEEFREKTMPVIFHYKALGLLVSVNGDQTREAVFDEIIDSLYKKAVEETGAN